jgi:hypothetical protein
VTPSLYEWKELKKTFRVWVEFQRYCGGGGGGCCVVVVLFVVVVSVVVVVEKGGRGVFRCNYD